MRSELEVEQLGAAPVITPQPRRKPKRPLVPMEWVAGAAAALLLVVLAYFVFSSRETKKVVPVGASARSVAVSRDGTRLAVGLMDGSLRVIDLAAGKLVGEPRSAQPDDPPLSRSSALALSPGESVLVLR